MRKGFLVVVLLAWLGIALSAMLADGSLATFNDQGLVSDNEFTSSSAFPTKTPTPTPTPTTTPTPSCSAGDTGYLNPSAEAVVAGDGWELAPTNAFADSGGFASNLDGNGDRHLYYNYGFSIDSSCVIAGIEVRLDWFLDSTADVSALRAELSWDGGTFFTTEQLDTTETTTEHTFVLGGPTDGWGRTWTVAELSDANFRVKLRAISGDDARDFFLDWVPVKVYYGP